MADRHGAVTQEMISVYERLARFSVGLIITGHLFVHERGRGHGGQAGIHEDCLVPGLSRLVEAVHRHGGVVFAQLSHAGSQSRVHDLEPLAPSRIANPLTGRVPRAATDSEVEHAVEAFGKAASRAVEAGFDGVHLHGANGYLISEFASPVTNDRQDRWSPGWDGGFPAAVLASVRAQVPATYPVTMKVGVVDTPAGGAGAHGQLEGDLVRFLREGRLDAVEVSCNLMLSPSDSAHQYVAVDRRRARQDWLFHRLGASPSPEAYYRGWAAQVRAATSTAIILVGGLRTVETMADIIRSGDADFVALARPFIREPDLVRQIERGRRGMVDCTSCNLCLDHSGRDTLRCWRVPRYRLLQHVWSRIGDGTWRR